MPVDPHPTAERAPHPALVIGLVVATALVILGSMFGPALIAAVVMIAMHIIMIAFVIQHLAEAVRWIRKRKAARRAHP
ncbi:hypothetical protein ACT89R_01745 [Rhodococcus qingshengii]